MFSQWNLWSQSIAAVLLGFTLAACAPIVNHLAQEQHGDPEPDCGFVQNVYRERLSWKGRTPIGFNIHKSVPLELIPEIEAAMRIWEQALGKPLFVIRNQAYSGPRVPPQDGMNTITWLTDWEADKAAQQARTTIYWTFDRLTEADIRINAKNFHFCYEAECGTRGVHFRSLMVHELGHVLGLRHEDRQESVMGTFLASATDRSQVAEQDVENLRCEY